MASLNVEAAPLRPTPVVMEFTRKRFPKDFTFGVATSAYQVEGSYCRGGKGYSIWDVFSNANPGAITGGSNGNEAVRMYDRYKDDIRLMKIMGFDAYRFSISWPRILPGGKLCLGINQEGIDYYNDLINTIIENGMKPYATLFHWDLPYLLEKEYGGFLSPKIVDDFREYAEVCFWEFGDRVKHWITTNEAWTYAVYGYVNRKFPPGNGYFGTNAEQPKKAKAKAVEDTRPLTKDLGQSFIPYRGASVAKEATVLLNNEPVVIRRLAAPHTNTTHDPEKAKEAYTVARHLLLSHAAAVQSYRKNFQKLQNGKIGMTNNINWFEPLNNTMADKLAARRGFDFMLGWFLEPVLTGQYPENMLEFAKDHITPFTEEESKLLKGSCDFLGINYYTTWYASHDPNLDADEGYNRDQMVKYYYVKDNTPIGESTGSSWLYIVPKGFYTLLKFINDTFNKKKNLPPIYITENGCDEQDDPKKTPFEACKDSQRVKYFYEHLQYLYQAIKDGIKVESYFAWSFCDNFEWSDGYKTRFGIIHIDFKNDFKRYRKDSAMWFTEFLNN